MNKIIIIALLLIFTGCASIAGNTPTLQYCPELTYVRKGNVIDITGHCLAPIGQSGLPVPLPNGL